MHMEVAKFYVSSTYRSLQILRKKIVSVVDVNPEEERFKSKVFKCCGDDWKSLDEKLLHREGESSVSNNYDLFFILFFFISSIK